MSLGLCQGSVTPTSWVTPQGRTLSWDPSPYMGPLMIKAMRKFMSAINSCRSGYGRSSSVLLGETHVGVTQPPKKTHHPNEQDPPPHKTHLSVTSCLV